jgi:DNA-3-methyladenine glycosylase
LPARLVARRTLLQPAERVAPLLLGAVLVHDSAEGRVAVRLTEVEAYAGEADAASHAWRGATPRTQVMFGPPGRAYVYFSYGMHWCMNVVTRPDGIASAVLLRAGEVVEGVALARSRRGSSSERDLARGPGRLCQALGLSGASTGVDVCDPSSALRLLARTRVPGLVMSGPRVGISRAAEVPWRFWIDGDRFVSGARRAPARP